MRKEIKGEQVDMEEILRRIENYAYQVRHYPVGTFHHSDAMRLLKEVIED